MVRRRPPAAPPPRAADRAQAANSRRSRSKRSSREERASRRKRRRSDGDDSSDPEEAAEPAVEVDEDEEEEEEEELAQSQWDTSFVEGDFALSQFGRAAGAGAGAEDDADEAAEDEEGDDGEDDDARTQRLKAQWAALDDDVRTEAAQAAARCLALRGAAGGVLRVAAVKGALPAAAQKTPMQAVEAARPILGAVFGLDVREVPAGRGKALVVVNKLRDAGHLSVLLHDAQAPARGLLMVVLGLLWCNGRRIDEPLLFRQLNGIDEAIGADCGEARRHPDFGTVQEQLAVFVSQGYLARSKGAPGASGESFYEYSMGPRAAAEVGWPQVCHFLAEVTGEEVSAATRERLAELSDS